jgi:ATP-dependent helicase/nuclease subunit A
MKYTEAQEQAITLDGNLVVTAGAGSGKTRVLVARYLRLLDTNADELTDILAITFTEKAAREMRERVRDATEQRARDAADLAARERWEDLRARVEAARIGTIHAFCAALLRAHPAESGLDPRFAVLDEVEQALLLDESVNAALQQVAAPGAAPALEATEVQALQEAFSLDDLRALLHGMVAGGPEVAAAVAALPTDPAALLTLWQRRLADAQAEVLAALLASAAWREAAATLRGLAPAATAADLIGKQVLAVAEWLPTLEQTNAGSLPDFAPVRDIKLNGGSKKNWPTAADLAAAKAALKALRECVAAQGPLLTLQPDPALEQRAAQLVPALCRLYQRAGAEYRRRKEQRDALDFDDLEQRARRLLEEHPAVRARWQAEFHAILVDEFQDTNDEQRHIIDALAGTGEQSPPPGAPLPALFVVGDGKQSIYRFRGADVSVFREVTQTIANRGGQIVALDTSFRTHPPLLAWINRVSEGIFAREHALRPYEIPFEPLHAHRPPPKHMRCAELHLISGASSAAQTRTEEARILAERIRALVDGNDGPLISDGAAWRTPKYGDIAILCQASTVFSFYEAALREADIPYLTTAGRGYYGRNEVQDLIHLVRVLNDPADELALVGVLRSPLFALSDATILRLRFANPRSLWAALLASDEQHAAPEDAPALAFARDTLRDLAALRGHLTVVELLRAALARTGYLATVSGMEHGSQRRVNIEKLLEAARQAGRSGLPDFSAYLESLLKTEPREGEAPLEAGGSVRLMTVHKSKGLEFPIVVLPDLGRRGPSSSPPWLARPSYGLALRLRDEHGDEQKSVAYHLARREEQQMETAERDRLLYVALTRAQDYLILSGAAATQSGPNWLSRLLGALGTPWEAGGPPAGPAGALEVWHHMAAHAEE